MSITLPAFLFAVLVGLAVSGWTTLLVYWWLEEQATTPDVEPPPASDDDTLVHVNWEN